MVLLAKVEATFTISGRGRVIVPTLLLEDYRVHVSDPIQLRTPDGQVRDTHITAVEFLSGSHGTRLAFMLPSEIMKQEVPEGTEIWLSAAN